MRSPDVDQPARRQLAAIMFTDIAGYTALMQSDEEQALRFLTRYRSTLQEALDRNNGELLQHIGDGSLTMFQSAVQAIRCAIELQRSLQQEPSIPLRAGLHLGDVVLESGSVYGDGVNVASRIEQLADPGSILITQAIYDSIKSQRTFRTKYLGAPKLRNVMEPTRVYAIRNRGIVVPERLTRQISIDLRSARSLGLAITGVLLVAFFTFGVTRLFGNKDSGRLASSEGNGLPKLVVTSLINHTGDRSMDDLGQMAAAHLTRQLKNTEVVRVCSREELNGDKYYELKGSFYKKRDVLVFQTLIADGNSGQTVSVLDPQVSSVDEPAEAFDEMAEQLLGFWPARNAALTSDFRAPRYSAFKEYQKGRESLLNSPVVAIDLFLNSIALDPNFISPRLGLIHAYYRNHKIDTAHAEVQKLKTSTLLTPHDLTLLAHWEYLLEGQVQSAFDTLSTILEISSDPEIVRQQLACIALERLQQPRRALRLIDPLATGHDQDISPISFAFYLETLRRLHRYERVVEAFENTPVSNKGTVALDNYVRALSRLGRNSDIIKIIDDCTAREYSWTCSAAGVARGAAKEFYLMGDTTSSKYFVSYGLGKPAGLKSDEVVLHYLGGHYNTAAAMFRELHAQSVDSIEALSYEVEAAIAMIHAGDSAQAIALAGQMMNGNNQTIASFLISYQNARIALALGDIDKALELLEDSARKGMPFSKGYFDQDIFLAPLLRQHRFERLTEAKD